MSRVSGNMKGIIAILWAISVAGMIFPVISAALTFSYPPTAMPVQNIDPALARPVAVGPVATGGTILTIQVSTTTFPTPVDMYLGIFALFLSPEIFLFTSDTVLQPLSQVAVKWRAGVTSANTVLFGNTRTEGFAPGTYFLLLMVTPANNLASTMLWQTCFTVEPPPVAPPQPDSYFWIGNTPLTVSALYGVLANDPSGLTVSSSDTQTTGGGTVEINTNGGFVYTPPFGFTGTDTFTYTVTGFAPVTASIQIDFLAWYVDNTAAAGGDGSFGSRFATLAAAVAAAGPGDTIFVFWGDGLDTNQDAGITLLDGQKLLGQGIAFSFPAFPMLLGASVEIVPAGNRPILSDVNGFAGAPVVTLADNNEVAGFSLASTHTEAILGDGVSGYYIHDNLIPDASGTGIVLSTISIAGKARHTVADNLIINSRRDGIIIEMPGPDVRAFHVEAIVTGNRIHGAGGLRGGIIADVSGNSHFFILLRQNEVSNSIGEAGIFLLNDDSSEVVAVVDGNILLDNQGAAGPADFIARTRGASSLCLELTNNVSNTAGGGVGAFLVENDSLPATPPRVSGISFFESNNQGTIEQAGAIGVLPERTCSLP